MTAVKILALLKKTQGRPALRRDPDRARRQAPGQGQGRSRRSGSSKPGGTSVTSAAASSSPRRRTSSAADSSPPGPASGSSPRRAAARTSSSPPVTPRGPCRATRWRSSSTSGASSASPKGRSSASSRRDGRRSSASTANGAASPSFSRSTRPRRTTSPSSPAASSGPAPGMIVEADRATLAVTEVFGLPDDPGVDARVVIRRYGLAEHSPRRSCAEAAGIPDVRPPRDADGRRDFRDWTSVTIDGENAQDFDDAVSIRPLAGGRRLLGVHIADVSHYVRPGTALDRERFRARDERLFSRPDPADAPRAPVERRLQPAAPRGPRLTVSVLLEIDEDGRVRQSRVPSLDHPDGRAADLHVGLQDLRGRRRGSGRVRRRRPRPPGDARAGPAASGPAAPGRAGASISTSSSPSSSTRRAGWPRPSPPPRTRPTSSSRSSWSRPTWPSPRPFSRARSRRSSASTRRPRRRPGEAPRHAPPISGSILPAPDKVRSAGPPGGSSGPRAGSRRASSSTSRSSGP